VGIDLAIKDDSTAWTLAAVGVNDSIKRQQLDLTAMTFESTLEGPVALAVDRKGLDTDSMPRQHQYDLNRDEVNDSITWKRWSLSCLSAVKSGIKDFTAWEHLDVDTAMALAVKLTLGFAKYNNSMV